MTNFWSQLAITIASSGLFVALLQALFGRFRLGRRSEQLSAWQNELEVLNKIDRTTGSGAALHVAARQGVYRSIANRLVPPAFWQAFGFFVAGLLTAMLSLTLFFIIEPAPLPWDIGRFILATLYTVLTCLAFAMWYLRPRASEKLRAAVLAGIEFGENTNPGAEGRLQLSQRDLFREQDAAKWNQIFDFTPSVKDLGSKKERKNNSHLTQPYKRLIYHAVEPTVRDGVLNFLRDLHKSADPETTPTLPDESSTRDRANGKAEDCSRDSDSVS